MLGLWGCHSSIIKSRKRSTYSGFGTIVYILPQLIEVVHPGNPFFFLKSSSGVGVELRDAFRALFDSVVDLTDCG